MRKLIVVVLSLVVVVLFMFQGFGRTFPLPLADAGAVSESSRQSITDALDDIYYNVDVMGVQEATAAGLAKEFSLDPKIFSEIYGRYTDGRFGIADVFVARPAPGKGAAVREALITIRTARTSLFKNFDIFGSSSIAENGVIYNRGDYMILLMIKDTEGARAILDEYIPA